MRFRLGTTGTGQSGADGFARGFQALFSAPMMQAQAAEQAQDLSAKRQLMDSQTRQADAHAALYNQQAEGVRTKLERGSLPELVATAALMNKVPLHQVPEVQQFTQTGQLPGQYVQPPEDLGGGPALPKPEYANQQGLGGQIMQTLGLLRGGLTAGGNIDQIAKAGGELQKQDAVRSVSADPASAGRVGQAFAASEGKPLIDNIGSTGAGFNKFTGEGGTIDPALRALYGDVQQADIQKDKASAANSYASAEQHKAQTEKLRTAGANAESFTDDDVRFMAQQYLRGDQSVLTNLGRGQQGAANIVRLRRAIRQEAEAAGMSPQQVATAVAQFSGDKAAFRTAGTKGANIEMAAVEADQAAGLALEYSQQFDRTRWMPVNKAIRAYQTNTGDPAVIQFGAANNALINTYARAISPSGTPTVHDKQHAEELLSTAMSPEQYRAVVETMKREIQAAQHAPGAVRDAMAARLSGTPGASHGRAPASAGAGPLRLSAKPQEADVQYRNLPSGAEFIAPDGSRRRKP